MARLEISVPDSVVQRIRVAFGHSDPLTQLWVDATVGEIETAIKQFIKSHVLNYETTLVAIVERNRISGETW